MKEINHEVDSLLVWSFPAIKQTLKEEALFQTHGKLEHLALMKRVLGPLPQAQQYCYVKESNIVNKVSGYGTKIVSSQRTSMLAGGGDSDGEGSSLSSIQVVDRAHAVVLAGGTLQPIEETRERLVPFLSPERLHFFSCSHIVPPESILPIVVSHGPSGRSFDFSFNSRSSPNQ